MFQHSVKLGPFKVLRSSYAHTFNTLNVTCYLRLFKHILKNIFQFQEFTSLRESFSYSEFFWLVSPAFGLNTERYSVSLRIQSECEKIQTRKTSNTDMFPTVRFSEITHTIEQVRE